MLLFYPNTYSETCCTSVLEAMACRCNIISSNLGALSETSNGFANLFELNIDTHKSPNELVKNPITINQIDEQFKKFDQEIYVENKYLVSSLESKFQHRVLDSSFEFNENQVLSFSF